eukprot:365679-Chlamydomonas_euryale.AAC.11
MSFNKQHSYGACQGFASLSGQILLKAPLSSRFHFRTHSAQPKHLSSQHMCFSRAVPDAPATSQRPAKHKVNQRQRCRDPVVNCSPAVGGHGRMRNAFGAIWLAKPDPVVNGSPASDSVVNGSPAVGGHGRMRNAFGAIWLAKPDPVVNGSPAVGGHGRMRNAFGAHSDDPLPASGASLVDACFTRLGPHLPWPGNAYAGPRDPGSAAAAPPAARPRARPPRAAALPTLSPCPPSAAASRRPPSPPAATARVPLPAQPAAPRPCPRAPVAALPASNAAARPQPHCRMPPRARPPAGWRGWTHAPRAAAAPRAPAGSSRGSASVAAAAPPRCRPQPQT